MANISPIQRSMIQKGVFGVAVVATVAVVGVVGFAKADDVSTTNGYGSVSDTQQAAATAFGVGYATSTTSWIDAVNGYIATLKGQLAGTTTLPADQFQSDFDSDNQQYVNSVTDAFVTFENEISTAKTANDNKDQFVDAFNHAKADYFNALEQAKNTLADQLNHLGSNDVNQYKDQFMNSYNSEKGVYGNQLEDAKNAFAAILG